MDTRRITEEAKLKQDGLYETLRRISDMNFKDFMALADLLDTEPSLLMSKIEKGILRKKEGIQMLREVKE